MKSLGGRPNKSAIRPFNARVREAPRRLFLAVSRRLGDEIHPSPLNGDFRPLLVGRDLIVEGPLRKQKKSFSSSYLTGTIGHFRICRYRKNPENRDRSWSDS